MLVELLDDGVDRGVLLVRVTRNLVDGLAEHTRSVDEVDALLMVVPHLLSLFLASSYRHLNASGNNFPSVLLILLLHGHRDLGDARAADGVRITKLRTLVIVLGEDGGVVTGLGGMSHLRIVLGHLLLLVECRLH